MRMTGHNGARRGGAFQKKWLEPCWLNSGRMVSYPERSIGAFNPSSEQHWAKPQGAARYSGQVLAGGKSRGDRTGDDFALGPRWKNPLTGR